MKSYIFAFVIALLLPLVARADLPALSFHQGAVLIEAKFVNGPFADNRESNLQLRLTGPDHQPLNLNAQISAAFSMTDMEAPPTETVSSGGGIFIVKGIYLGMGGRWQVDVTLTENGASETRSFTLEL